MEETPRVPGERPDTRRGPQLVQSDPLPGDEDSASGIESDWADLERPLAGPGSHPQAGDASAEPLDRVTLVSTVNRSLEDLWERENLRPASPIADSEWLQRVFQFVLGREPDPRELAAFVSDPSPDKQARWVERLHSESHYVDEYARFWADFWTTNWLGHANAPQGTSPANREGFERYLEKVIAEDQSFQDLVFDLLAAEGSGDPLAEDYHGATNFLLTHHQTDAVSTTQAVSRLLLGRRLDCAQCHPHPFHSEWTQQEFWELNAFFRQLHVDQLSPDAPVRLTDRDVADEAVYFEEPNGYQRAAYPVLPDGSDIPPSGKVDEVRRRELLARWVADSEDFPRVVVNRAWAHFFGYGLVHPVDDMGPHNPPTDSELLDLLAQQFVAHQYSLRRLTQWIVLSDAFQRSSTLDERNLADVPERGEAPRFSRFYLRPSAPIPTWDALQQLARWRSDPGSAGDQARRFMAGRLARLLSSDPVRSDEGRIIDGGTDDTRVMPEGMLLLQPGTNRTEGLVLEQILKASESHDEIVRHLFWAALGRPPEPREVELARQMISDSPHPETVFHDIWWTLVNSQEFLLHP